MKSKPKQTAKADRKTPKHETLKKNSNGEFEESESNVADFIQLVLRWADEKK